MSSHVHKKSNDQEQSVANAPQQQKPESSDVAFNDLRSTTIAQRKLQSLANQSPINNRFEAIQRVADSVLQRYPPKGYSVGDHFEDQMGSRGISEETVDDVVNNGTAYIDSKFEGATVYHKDGIAVVYDGSKLQTCYAGKVKNRWEEK